MNQETIGNYRLLRELGTGGMGAVYEAVDLMLERHVALKMLRPEIARKPDLIERFRAEAITLAKLNHPGIATLYAFLHEGEHFAMVMEYVPGHSLEALLAGAGRLHPALAAELLRQTLDGVAHAHALGVLHRDIKPANILITGDRQVKVTDFGIARILGASRMTREGKIIGTLEYIAPERIRGEAEDHRCDLYSAGVVLFEMLAGRLPFTSDTDYGLLQAHLQQAPPDLTTLGVDCPPQLQAVLKKALAKSPNDRYQTAWEFREALARAVPPAPALKPTRLAEPLPPPKSSRRPVIAAAALAAVLLTAGAGTIAWYRTRPAEPVPQPVAAMTTPPPPPTPAPAPIESAPPVIETPAFLQQPPAPAPAPVEAQAPLNTSRRQSTPAAKPAPQPAAPIPVPIAPAPTPAPVSIPVDLRPTPEPPARPAPPPRPKNVRAIRHLYVEKMANGLDAHLKEEIRKQIPTLGLTTNRAEADALMVGAVEKHDDKGTAVTRGYLGMKSEFSAAISITDTEGRHLLWSGEAGDARAVIGAFRKGGPKKVAERLVSNLKKAMEP